MIDIKPLIDSCNKFPSLVSFPVYVPNEATSIPGRDIFEYIYFIASIFAPAILGVTPQTGRMLHSIFPRH